MPAAPTGVSTTPAAPDNTTSPSISGVVVGSYFVNAKVCLDINSNGRCDTGEPSTRSDKQGGFRLAGSGAGIVAEIGTDATELDPSIPSSKPVTSPLVLRAPKEAPGVVDFQSTAVVAEMEANGLDFQAATGKVAISVGVIAAKLLGDINTESDPVAKAALKAASDEGLQRIRDALASAGSGDDVKVLVTAAALTDRYYQTKAPYRPQQDVSTYEAAPAGFSPVYTEVVARHGSRGLSGLKYDLAVYNMWKKAQGDGALTPLGEKLGPDVLKIMKANFLLGYGVAGISTPGYGNETQVGINEHTQLAARLVQRLPAYWKQIGDSAGTAPRQIVTVTSGVDRAVDSGNFFVQSLKAVQPALAPLLTYPPAPAPYPDNGTAVSQPAGTNRFLLYFHKLVKATDLVTNPADPLYNTYQASLAYQDYKSNDADLLAKQSGLTVTPEAAAAGRVLLERLFAKSFVDKIANGTYSFANSGSFSYTSDDGKFAPSLSGDGKTSIKSIGDAGSLLYELYVIAPAMRSEAGVDFTAYMPAAQAKFFAALNDGSDFYDKGPGMTEKGDITSRMAQILVDDMFNEVDAIARGDRSHAAKLRFTHAEIMMPFAVRMGLKGVDQSVPKATGFSYDSNAWRGQYVSPMAANMQWDVFAGTGSKLLVRMLYNERETDFKAACDAAKAAGTAHYYEYTALKACYGHVAQ
ncbi:histidine-type phosphatase [Variovorax sp. J22G21]|uniref:histidine-type phosphatase n=1 Tax=Variovorax fucosicus TaxID=3053517 RepID=UPI0025771B64|nr:histidine-type phosphatase [Variovorax sp. J22G21]MDM0038358.1 histidine-type phosphatase [Variovorax sp. J22R193]MDM0063134.1 histidine-type phosphatase [Variovorax sp. J22G21]